MSTPPRLLGAVLAGGEGRRFGGDKTRTVVGGATLVDRAATTLSEVFGDVVVVGPAERGAPWPTIGDLRPAPGPLGGIEAGLKAAEERGLAGVFVLACDLPLVGGETVRRVASALTDVAAAAASREGEPPIEPLCAAYDVACLVTAQELLDAGERAAHALFDAVAGVTVAVPAGDFVNVNTAEDAQRAESLLRERAR